MLLMCIVFIEKYLKDAIPDLFESSIRSVLNNVTQRYIVDTSFSECPVYEGEEEVEFIDFWDLF